VWGTENKGAVVRGRPYIDRFFLVNIQIYAKSFPCIRRLRITLPRLFPFGRIKGGDSGRCRSVFRGMPITRSGMIPIS
jgi:hypothetical protein